MFMDLEKIMPVGVHVVSIQPQLVKRHMFVRLTVAATRDESKIKFLHAMIADCNHFDGSLLPASTGNSAITAELDELARKSGVQVVSLGLRHKDIVGRNLTQVDLDTIVSGNYSNIVKFMNSVQRSKNF